MHIKTPTFHYVEFTHKNSCIFFFFPYLIDFFFYLAQLEKFIGLLGKKTVYARTNQEHIEESTEKSGNNICFPQGKHINPQFIDMIIYFFSITCCFFFEFHTLRML